MRIRTKIFLITGLVFSSLVLISSISMWTMKSAGDAFLVPGGLAHAIGEGVFMI